MHNIQSTLRAVSVLFAFFMFCASAAHAQATRTWVSGVGNNSNSCSRTAPCKTFAGAIVKTAAGGEISVLDPGGFGAVTITKSISIVNDYSGEAGILAAGSNGILVNAGASDVILLRGLVIDGAGGTSPAINGIRFLAGGALHVQKCVIKNFRNTAVSTGIGIFFTPSGASKMFVSDTYILNNGGKSNGGAIMIQPNGSSVVKVTLNNVQAMGNVTGITAIGTDTTGNILVDLVNSVSSGAPFTGMSIVTPASGGALTVMMADRSSIVNNVTGVNAAGPKSFAYLTDSTVFGNSTGLNTTSGGSILSYQHNNVIGGNSPTDGAPTGTLNQN